MRRAVSQRVYMYLDPALHALPCCLFVYITFRLLPSYSTFPFFVKLTLDCASVSFRPFVIYVPFGRTSVCIFRCSNIIKNTIIKQKDAYTEAVSCMLL